MKAPERMRFAYADPPYLGCAHYYAKHHPDAMIWDDPETHRRLIERLSDEFPDGWAMSLTSSNLHDILPMCPRDCRVMAWVKPFASFKLGVGLAYAWEPVILRGGRKRQRTDATTRDWVSESITMRRGFTGAKPRRFCHWIFDALAARPGDDFHDLFPGSGAVSAAWAQRCGAQPDLPLTPLEAMAAGGAS